MTNEEFDRPAPIAAETEQQSEKSVSPKTARVKRSPRSATIKNGASPNTSGAGSVADTADAKPKRQSRSAGKKTGLNLEPAPGAASKQSPANAEPSGSVMKKMKAQATDKTPQVSETPTQYKAEQPTAPGSDPHIHGTQTDPEIPSISRREKRRLEWIERRRQWRDQRKNERDRRRDEQDAPEAEPGDRQTATSDATSGFVTTENDKPDLRQPGSEHERSRNKNRGRQAGSKARDRGRRDEHGATGDAPVEPESGVAVDSVDTTQGSALKEPSASSQKKKGNRQNKKPQQPAERNRESASKTAGPGNAANVQTAAEIGSKERRKDRAEKGRPVQTADVAPPPLPEPPRELPPPKHYFVYKDPAKKPGLSDEAEHIVERVESYMNSEFLAEDGAGILVCVSGGVDSVVLLDILHVLSFEHGYNLNVVHVNHGLRGVTAKRDEKFVRALAQKYDVQCHISQVKADEFAKKHSLSEEMAARELRYKFFRQTASTLRVQFCAMAHNADDAAETLLMNLFRGTGLTGLASIPPRRALVKKTQLIRPLLILSKQEILEYATQRELEWFEDETNTMTKYTRNKVRHDLMPRLKQEYNPKIIESLNRTANLLRKADGFIESVILATYHSVVSEREDSSDIDVHQLEALHSFVQGEVVERAVTALTYGKTISFASVDRVLSLITKKAGARESILNNLIAVRDRDSIILMYEQHLQEVFLSIYKIGEYAIGRYSMTLEECHRNDVRIGQDKMIEYFDYDKLPYRLTLRTWHPGDSFHPIGFQGHMKVSDVLTNEKVDHAERHNALVLSTAADIVWLCGIRMSDEFKISNETRRIVRATFTKK